MMDMGQITQGLRADVLQQASGQGINVAQMMENGVSFADIMLLILQNTQSIANGQGIPVTSMPQMNNQADGQISQQENQNEMTFVPDMKNLMPNMVNVVSVTEMPDTADVVNMTEMPDMVNVVNVADVPDAADVVNVSDKTDIQNTENILLMQNADEMLKSPDIHSMAETPEVFNVQNSAEKLLNSFTENKDKSVDYLKVQTEKKSLMPQMNDIDNLSDIPVIENIWQMTQNSDREFKHTENVHMPQMHNFQNEQISVTDNSLINKISDLIGLISPEQLNSSENSSSLINNNFVIDLLSQLDTEGEIKDSFDFSESMLKIDPMQLAGLLDFISTGSGIPQAMDISDSEMFKNIKTVEAVNNSAGKMIFGPEEMIKSGEMEIISYEPAQKNPDSSSWQQPNKQTDENIIDLARTMKGVKENVKSETSDDTSEFSKISASLANVNPDELVQKKDISFERAYAELEMNKAKYGSADEQLYKGISENLERGRSKFTVKLRPEGLGEILVKLVSDEGGKAVLTMVASSEKTAELLNRDLASLQTSLNQHNVEIENNSVKVAETVMHSETAFDQYNERQRDEANQQQHFRQLKKKIGDISDRNISFDAETESVTSAVSDSALNITI